MSFIDILDVEENENVFDYKKHIVSENELNSKLEDYLTGKIKKGYGVGLPVLDNVVVCKTNELYACTGKKGRGKTTIQVLLIYMWSMIHNLRFVLCLQENDSALIKQDLLGYLFNEHPRKVYSKDKLLYDKAVKFIDDRIIFLKDIDSFKEATEVTEAIIKSGIEIQALFLDPVNTFENGWYESGNSWLDDKKASKKVLKFAKSVCSVFVSQHPNMTAQRRDGDVNSADAENGHFLNKSDFTWVVNRDNGSNENRITVDNVRNKYTGGGVTHPDTPLIIHWHPYHIDVEHDGVKEENIIQKIRKKYNPLGEDLDSLDLEIKKEIPTATLDEAFGDDIPF